MNGMACKQHMRRRLGILLSIFFAERKACATLHTTAVRIVVISSDPVAAILTSRTLHTVATVIT